MKKRLVYLQNVAFGLLIVALAGCNSNNGGEHTNGVDTSVAENNKSATNPNAQNPEPVLKFDETEIDFGKIYEGEKVYHTFRYTNAGNEDLIIRDCKTTCGCTVAKCDKKPLKPGESSELKIEFDSQNKVGIQSKQVTITANTNPPTQKLTFRAEVLPQ